MQLKLPPGDKNLLAARAQHAALSYSEYVMALLHNEPVDDNGRPTWLAPSKSPDSELPLAM